jgi:hypothetical protein
MLLNPPLALRILMQLHPDQHPNAVRYVINGDNDKAITIEYDALKGIKPTQAQIENVLLLFEDSVKLTPWNRGVRFDVYFEGETAVINFEMQHGLEKFIDYRLHLLSSLIIAYQTESGAKFNELKPVYITFLCIEDPYGLGLRKYTWKTGCVEAPILQQAFSPVWTVYNASGTDGDVSENIHDLLEYFKDPDAYDMTKTSNKLIPDLHKAAQRAMQDGRIREMLSRTLIKEQSIEANAEYRGEVKGRQEGIRIGEVKGRHSMALSMIQDGEPDEKVKKYTGYTRATV